MKSGKIDAFAKRYRAIAKQAQRSDSLVMVTVAPSELTAHADVNRSLVQAARHAMNGEVLHFDACIQDARNAHNAAKARAREAIKNMSDEDILVAFVDGTLPQPE